MTIDIATSVDPYADTAPDYIAKGWVAPLPLPAGAKGDPPAGFTGWRNSRWASLHDIEGFIERSRGTGANIGNRAPRGVVGVDYDAYRDPSKVRPGHSYADRIDSWGQLPPTWASTSRDDGSMIRWYRVPEGTALPGDAGDDVEIIHSDYRYAVAPPSRHPDGPSYRWLTPAGETTTEIPHIDELPELPEAWVEGLNGLSRARVTDTEVVAFIDGLVDGDYDQDTQNILDEFSNRLTSESGWGRFGDCPSTQSAMLRITTDLAIAGACGAPGVPGALAAAEDIFVTYRISRGDGAGDAAGSWTRALAGAVGYVRDNGIGPLERFVVPADILAAFDAHMTERSPAKTYDPYSTADAHLGARIADQYLLGRWCFATGLGWLRWDGRRWEPVSEHEAGEAIRLALRTAHARDTAGAAERLARKQAEIRAQYDGADGGSDADKEMQSALASAAKDHTDRLKALSAYFNIGKMTAVLKVARGYLVQKAAIFDTHPYLLNVGNGVVDLRTGLLVPHRPDFYFTKITATNYIPAATHPDWDKALTALPAEVADWMQVRFGQAATGLTPSDDIVPIVQGGGENGKTSVFLGVRKALGDFAITVPDKALLASPGDHPTELMTLRGARLALIEETPEARHLDAKRLKTLAGTEQITARLIAQNNVSWDPTHSLFVTSNFKPRVDESDHGTWRRLALVVFPFRFSGTNGDPGLRPRLRDGRDGQHEAALAWLVKGSIRWAAGGEVMPTPPEAVQAATKAWRAESDVLTRFLAEMTEKDDGAAVLSREFYDVFRDWSTAHGYRPWGDQLLWDRFKSHEWMDSGAVSKPDGTARLGGRYFSSAQGARKPSGPARYLFGLRFVGAEGVAGV